MKKSFTLSMLLMAGATAFAQNAISSATITPAFLPNAAAKTDLADTLTQYMDRATAFYSLSGGSNGYVLGTSSISSQTAEHYDAVGSATVTHVFAYFSNKTVMGNGADSARAIVYTAGTDSMPLAEIGSGKFSVGDADVTGFPTIIPVTAQMTNGGFLVAIEYGGAGMDDSLALTSSNPTTQSGGPDGAGEKRCRQYNSQTGWLRAATIWTIAGGPYNADAMIIPVVDLTAVGVESYVTKAGLSLLPSFPNPANNSHLLVWANDSQEDITIRVFNVDGRVVLEETVKHTSAGKQSFNLNTGAWASGKYFYMISSGKATLASKFMVQH